MSFAYVRIPADSSSAIVSLQASTSGGLSDDALVRNAKEYFFQQSGAALRLQQFESATPEQKQALANQVRQNMPPEQQKQMHAMKDDDLLNLMIRSKFQPSCDIVALTIPAPANQYQAVSLYMADAGQYAESSEQSSLSLNARAMALLTACGHGTREIHGDVFVGRAIDNERDDVWKRVDFTTDDTDPSAKWCEIARSPGGGGGNGSSSAASLNGLVQQQGGGGTQVITNPQSQSTSMFGMNGAAPVVEDWGTWNQTDEDVEVRFLVDSTIKSKDCKVTFGRNKLKVVVNGSILLDGALFDPVEADDCTFTLQTTSEGRELCVTLVKAQPNNTWSLLTKKQ